MTDAPLTFTPPSPRQLLAMLGLTALSLLQLAMVFSASPGLSALLFLTLVVTALGMVRAPWLLTLLFCALWPLMVDPPTTLRIIAGDTGMLQFLHRWAAKISPYPLTLTVMAVIALGWGWRLALSPPKDRPSTVHPLAALCWVWIAGSLGATLIGLAAFNPLATLSTWQNMASDLGRWPSLAGVDRFHPLAMGYAAIISGCFYLAVRHQMASGQDPEADRRALWRALITSGVMVALIGLVQHWDPSRLVVGSATWVCDRRITGPLRDPNTCAALLSVVTVVLVPEMWMRWEQWSRPRRGVTLFSLVVLVSALVFTGSRVALFGVPLLLGGWALWHGRHSLRPTRPRVAALCGALVLLSVLWSAVPLRADAPRSTLLQRIEDTLHWEEESGAMRRGLAGRPHHWATARAMISDHPLSGQGLGTSLLLYEKYRAPDNPFLRQNLHSEYLQTWAERGLIGLLTLLALFGLAICNPRAPVGVKLGVGVFALVGVTGHPLVLPEMHLLFWLLMIQCGRSLQETKPWSRRRWTLIAFAVFAFGAISAVPRGIQTQRESVTGVYEVFREDSTGVPSVWTRGETIIHLPVEGPRLLLPLRAGHPDVGGHPVQVVIEINGEIIHEDSLTDATWALWILDLHPWMGETVTFTLRVDRTWSPLRDLGIPDSRELALALGPWRWLDDTLTGTPTDPWPIPPLR